MQAAAAALHRLNEHKPGRAARTGVHGADALGRQLMRLHRGHHFKCPGRRKDDAEPAAEFEDCGGGGRHIVQSEISLVPGDALCLAFAQQGRTLRAVGRVAHRQRALFPTERAPDFAHITLMHMYALLQTVQVHAARRHIGHLGLNLHCLHTDIALMRRHQYGDGAVAAAQIRNSFPLAGVGKIRQQHRIRAKAEGSALLYQLIITVLQIIQAFTRLQFHIHTSSFSG